MSRNKERELEQRLGNLLARIHRDGGDYVACHGWEKAEADADAKIIKWIARDDEEREKWDGPTCKI